jgi:uncharacterized membrane protein YciS (DUF1049 family)
MSNINTTDFTNNLTLLALLNETTTSTLAPLNALMSKLGFQAWQAAIMTFILPPINLMGAVFCSFSLCIFFRSPFSDPIYFYYKLLCFINILNLLHNIPYGVTIWPLYFPWINSYLTSVYKIYHSFFTVLFFHFEDVLTMAILLHKMKLFSPFVKKHFSKSPQFISLSLFLTCLFINVPFIFGFEVVSYGDYYYSDSNGVKQTTSFYYLISSEFSQTSFGQILLGFSLFFLNFFLSLIVGITLNISSYIKYKLHVRKRQREIEELQMSSIHNRPTTNREMLQLNEREKIERKIEKNMLFMALTLCSISILTRFLLMITFIYIFVFNTFSNSILIQVINYFNFTLGPTVSIFIFYSFNNAFRDEMNKRLRLCKD